MFCSRIRATNIYLLPKQSLTPFDSFVRAPLPKFGFLTRGVYLVSLFCFQKNTFLWHFSGHPLITRLRLSPPLDFSTLGYFFPRHEHYNHHRLCEHGLSSIVTRTTAFVFRITILFHIPFFQVALSVS